LFLAIFALTAFLLFKGMVRQVPSAPNFGRFLAGFSIIVLGLLVSSSSFYGLRAVYQTVAMPIDLIATPPFSGYFSPSSLVDNSLNSLIAPSNPATSERDSWGTAASKNSIQVRGAEGSLRIKWTVVPENRPFSLEVRVFKNCQFLDLSESLPETKPSYKHELVSKLSIDTNKGFTTLFANFVGKSSIQHSPDFGTFYWSESNSKTERPVQTFFLSEKSLDVAKSEGEIELRVAVPPAVPIASPTPAVPTRSRLILLKRTVSLNLDGRRIDLRVKAKPNEDKKPTLGKCVAVEKPLTLSDNPPTTLEIETGQYGTVIVLLLKPIKVDKLSNQTFGVASTTEFTGLRGDAEFTGPSFPDTIRTNTKRLDLFSINGNVKDLVFANDDVSIGPDDDVVIIGEVVISRIKNDGLRVQGNSTKVWKNNRRLNLTRWERLSEGWKLALVTALLSMLGAIIFNFRKVSPDFWTEKFSVD
jgi:hypothetical protein